MSFWEYQTKEFDTKGWAGGVLDTSAFNEALNKMGSEGWELVSCFDTNQTYGSSKMVIAVFKRQRD